MDEILKAITGLTGVKDVTEKNAAEALATFKTSHDESTAKVEELEGQLAEAQKAATAGKLPEVDEDVLEDTAESRTSELQQLVKEAKITPAVSDALAAALIGKPGKRLALGLSTKTAKALGLVSPLAKAVIDALKLNDPVKLGEVSKRQTLALGRDVPDADAVTLDPDLGKRGDELYGPAPATTAAA